jgi:1-acyl-sn-glycerol-3-phosphate acyltransferase
MNVIPCDQEGSDISALKVVIRLLKAGHATVIFPEGTRTRDGKIQAAQPGIGMIVAKTLVPVLPMRVFGAFEAFPRGGKHFQFSPIRVVAGDVMRFSEEDFAGPSKEAYARVSSRIMDRIASLELPPE